MEDRDIIKQVKNGDIEQFRCIVEKYHRPLLSFIYTLTRSRSWSEDIGQMVFLAFFKNLDSFDEDQGPPLSAWLFVTARNMSINALRKESPLTFTGNPGQLDCISSEHDPAEALIRKNNKELLDDCLSMLEEPYRTTLIESLKGSSIAEIAAKEQVLPGTVKSRLYRAKEKCITLFREKLARGTHD